MRARGIWCRIALMAVAGVRLHAQEAEAPHGVRPEIRADAIVVEGRSSVQVGGGVQIPAGIYARIGVIGALGPGIGGADGLHGRVDVLTRFLFDPFRQSDWGVSGGGGITIARAPGQAMRPRLLLALDVEGRRRESGVAPAFQLGLGDGIRIGMALRWGSARVR